jgi:hypothetical protein
MAIVALPWLLLVMQGTLAALGSPSGGAATLATDEVNEEVLNRMDSIQVVFGSTLAPPQRRIVSAPESRRSATIASTISIAVTTSNLRRRPLAGRKKSIPVTRKLREQRRKPRGRLLSSDGFEDDVTNKGDRYCDDFESYGGGGGDGHGDDGGGYRYNYGGQSVNSSVGLNPCHEEAWGVPDANDDSNHDEFPDNTDPNGTEVTGEYAEGNNHVALRVYVALRPNEASRGALVTEIVSLYVNATNNDRLWIDLAEHYSSDDDLRSGGSSRERRDQEPSDAVEDSSYQNGTNAAPVNATFVVRHHHTDSELELEAGDWWWWEYEIWYDCFSPDLSPVFEPASLEAVTGTLRNTLQLGLESGDFYRWMMNMYNGSFGALDISTYRDSINTADPTTQPTNSSQVFLTVYIAFRPREPARRTFVTAFLSGYLMDANPSYLVFLTEHDDELERRQERSLGSREANWTMVHSVTYSDTVKKEAVWWWEFNLVYDCFSATSNEPVTDGARLGAVSSDVQRTIQGGIDDGSIYVWLRQHFSGGYSGILNMTTHSYMIGEVGGPSVGHSSSDSEDPSHLVDPDKLAEYRTPVDPSEWNWLRFLGLGVFAGTVLVTFILMHIAAYRRRAMAKQETWGNLGTVKGVEEVLQTGWKIKGSNMEIFDKSKLGYDDDQGSLLIGGYEQRVILGAEISIVKHQGSEATPETHPNSFTHRTLSEYASEHLRLPEAKPPRRTDKKITETKPDA